MSSKICAFNKFSHEMLYHDTDRHKTYFDVAETVSCKHSYHQFVCMFINMTVTNFERSRTYNVKIVLVSLTSSNLADAVSSSSQICFQTPSKLLLSLLDHKTWIFLKQKSYLFFRKKKIWKK